MLVLTRKVGDTVVIDGRYEVKVTRIEGNRVRLSFDVPADVSVLRKELLAPERVDEDPPGGA